MNELEIKAYPDGPYVIAGRVAATDSEGRTEERPGMSVALCRCGHSDRLPFCDGTHKAAGFKAPETKLVVRPDGVEK